MPSLQPSGDAKKREGVLAKRGEGNGGQEKVNGVWIELG